MSASADTYSGNTTNISERDKMQYLAIIGAATPAFLVIALWLRGSVMSRKSWHKNAVEKGTRDWVKINETRRDESWLLPGWKKGDAAMPYATAYVVVSEDNKSKTEFTRHHVKLVTYHTFWRSWLGLGMSSDFRDVQIIDGAVVVTQEDGTSLIAPKSDEVTAQEYWDPIQKCWKEH